MEDEPINQNYLIGCDTIENSPSLLYSCSSISILINSRDLFLRFTTKPEKVISLVEQVHHVLNLGHHGEAISDLSCLKVDNISGHKDDSVMAGADQFHTIDYFPLGQLCYELHSFHFMSLALLSMTASRFFKSISFLSAKNSWADLAVMFTFFLIYSNSLLTITILQYQWP